jgi:hypothetical protein
MIDDDAPIDEELTRRLRTLAATTTLDPDAWDTIVARTSGAGGRVTHRPGRGLVTLAVAAAVVVVAAAGVLLAGGGSAKVVVTTVPETTAPTAPGTSVPAFPAGVTGPPCPDDPAATCVDTDAGDVDGDGAVDQVAVYFSPLPPGVTTTVPVVPGQPPVEVTLRVEYASGTQEEVGLVGFPPAIELLGVTDLDGDGREEVAWIYDAGAHSRIGGFVGTTGTGSLHVVGYAEPEILYDAAALEVLGFACPDLDGDGRNEMVVTDYYASVDDAQLTVWTYRWSGDRLQQIDQHEETVPMVDADGDGVDDRRAEIRGPHCGDLHAVS